MANTLERQSTTTAWGLASSERTVPYSRDPMTESERDAATYRELLRAALDVAADAHTRVQALERRVTALTDELRRYTRSHVRPDDAAA